MAVRRLDRGPGDCGYLMHVRWTTGQGSSALDGDILNDRESHGKSWYMRRRGIDILVNNLGRRREAGKQKILVGEDMQFHFKGI